MQPQIVLFYSSALSSIFFSNFFLSICFRTEMTFSICPQICRLDLVNLHLQKSDWHNKFIGTKNGKTRESACAAQRRKKKSLIKLYHTLVIREMDAAVIIRNDNDTKLHIAVTFIYILSVSFDACCVFVPCLFPFSCKRFPLNIEIPIPLMETNEIYKNQTRDEKKNAEPHI